MNRQISVPSPNAPRFNDPLMVLISLLIRIGSAGLTWPNASPNGVSNANVIIGTRVFISFSIYQERAQL